MLKKIVIIGPESTGKSTLCEQLAKHYNTSWCPEYARQFLLEHGTHYSYDDLLTIAKGQLELEEKCIQSLGKTSGPEVHSRSPMVNSELLFIDTNMYVMKVWCEFVFGKCHQFILDQIKKRTYHFYLLCNVDLPWTYDELREYPDIERRKKLYRMYEDLMENQGVSWIKISGNSEQRLEKAIKAVDGLIRE